MMRFPDTIGDSIHVIFFCLFLAVYFIPEIEDVIGKIKK